MMLYLYKLLTSRHYIYMCSFTYDSFYRLRLRKALSSTRKNDLLNQAKSESKLLQTYDVKILGTFAVFGTSTFSLPFLYNLQYLSYMYVLLRSDFYNLLLLFLRLTVFKIWFVTKLFLNLQIYCYTFTYLCLICSSFLL